jgi:hypothetical protein
LDGQGGTRACGSRRRFWDRTAIDIAAWPCGSFSRNNVFNFGAAVMLRAAHGCVTAPIRVEIYASDETVEIFVEADFEIHAEQRRRFAILNIPRNLFSEASGAAARRSSTSSLKNRVVR